MTFNDIKEIACVIFFLALVVALCWLYCLATPDQLTGDPDMTAATTQEENF